jgi:hypothetical protein
LYGLGDVDIHANNDYVFRYACHRGHLSVAQWLYDLGGVDIHVEDDFAFREACVSGHLPVAQWLYSMGGISYHNLKASLLTLSTDDNGIRSWLQSIIEDS